jgi:hypothetical protein
MGVCKEINQPPSKWPLFSIKPAGIFLCVIITIIVFEISCSSPVRNPFERPYKIDFHTPDKVFKVGVPAELDTPNVGGNRPITFRVIPTLPSGLSFDTSTGLISGIPEAARARDSFTVSAINSEGSFAVKIYITILPEAPKALTYSFDSAVYTINVPIAQNVPSYSGGTPAKYECAPTLPAGLNIDALLGTIYGTPTTLIPQAQYTIIACNSGGTTQTTLTITVQELTTPPKWHSRQIAASVNDGAMFSFALRDSCKDMDLGARVTFKLFGDSSKCSIIKDSLFSFSAGMLDSTAHVVKIVASKGALSDTATVTITIVPVYFSLGVTAQNGTVTLSPDKTSFRMGQTATLTAVPAPGYGFVNWTGSVTSNDNPVKIVMTEVKNVKAVFQKYTPAQCNQLLPGANINDKILELYSVTGESQLCPAPGKYDAGTIEIEGKVTIQIKSPF